MYSLHLRMHMFGLEGSGFIVAIAVTLLISGVVVYYCNTRLKQIESSVRNQNKVLGDFIASVQEGIIMAPSQQENGNIDMSQIAPMPQTDLIQHVELDKDDRIVVTNASDSGSESGTDSGSESGSESESDSGSESGSESDANNNSEGKDAITDVVTGDVKDSVEDAVEDAVKDAVKDAVEDVVKVIDLKNAESNPSNITVTDCNEEDESDESDDSDDSDDISTTDKQILTPATTITPEISTLENVVKPVEKVDINKMKKDYNQLRVAELRSLVLKHKLADTSTVKNLKKPSLVSLLSNHANKETNATIEAS